MPINIQIFRGIHSDNNRKTVNQQSTLIDSIMIITEGVQSRRDARTTLALHFTSAQTILSSLSSLAARVAQFLMSALTKNDIRLTFASFALSHSGAPHPSRSMRSPASRARSIRWCAFRNLSLCRAWNDPFLLFRDVIYVPQEDCILRPKRSHNSTAAEKKGTIPRRCFHKSYSMALRDANALRLQMNDFSKNLCESWANQSDKFHEMSAACVFLWVGVNVGACGKHETEWWLLTLSENMLKIKWKCFILLSEIAPAMFSTR